MSGQYRVILADPPWSFSAFNPETASRHITHQYATMTTDQIAALPVLDMAADDAALCLWATMPHLPDALRVMAAWGFAYKTCLFTWVKTTKAGTPATGMGYYTRSNAELCLLGIRGRMERKAHDISQIIATSRRAHSRKPDEQYGRIMRLFDGPYLEVFARQQWPGWSVAFSNQDGKFPAQPFLFGEEVSA